MLTCFILDDEQHAIDVLRKYIERTAGIDLAGYETEPLIALKLITQLQPDVLFLDIHMPAMNGLEFMNKLNIDIRIVFTTGNPNHAVDAYNREVDDFLLKPISYDRFKTCVERLATKVNQSALPSPPFNFFYIQGDMKSKIIKISTDDLQYVQSLNNYVILYHRDEKVITYLTMKEIERYLPTDQFSRIHKSYLINDRKIKTIESGHVILFGQPPTALPIGVKYREPFFSKIRKNTLRRGDMGNTA
ncbi:LytR/AlgR family response regulator transcription factor [Mucilaginibacter sp. KACC 22063]|uniref:LytR/AlgR family response regulator transcription factor n=1 Tax=Mucilaginibacter sp. KACC 22063 TaxID=3025666 RepID=UPI0023671F0B|nr:LytTR family DNA-binding domain-containing protein [Mucilaginibacter sp. KACC 22063]WDF54233.1 LytTR family DNA-binding domain-containing protein [Mucilaginibacter sp. KACC 22063]